MPRNNHISLIEEREREIALEIARLQEEANEIAVTLKVFRRFANAVPGDAMEGDDESVEHDGQAESDPDSKLGPPRPSGCPTNYEMVDMILSSAEREGKDGLTISEIVSEMRKRYWPGLKSAQVSAPIYAMARKGRFKKTSSGKFKRVRKNVEGQPLIVPNQEESTSDEGNGHHPMNG